MKRIQKFIIDAEPGEIIEYPLMSDNIIMALQSENIKINSENKEKKLKLSNPDNWDNEYKVE